MPYKDGKVDMKAYGGLLDSKRKALAKRKAKVKPIGSVVQSPDQQYKTGQMGKQPIKVYP
jgi:hypothetical protein